MVATTARHVDIETGEGSMGTFVVHPSEGGPSPVVLFLMDAPGKRPLLHSMATRLAEHGYYVMLPNLYYRTTPAFELDFASRESFERMRELMGALGNRMVARDAAALFGFAEQDPAADADVAGCVGYCMSGPFALFVAAEHAGRVRAAASFYGTWLVSDSEGKYSYCGLPPRSHTLKVDSLTLPRGSRLTTSSNRNLGDAGSLFIDLKAGELHRADFIEGSCSATVVEQVKARRAQGEVRAPETERKGSAPLRLQSKPLHKPQQATDGANQTVLNMTKCMLL